MKLYVIKELPTNRYIFNARGGAYKDISYLRKKIDKLMKSHPGMRYQLVVFTEDRAISL